MLTAMNFAPSKIKAALTGAWSALGIASFGGWAQSHNLEPITQALAFVVVMTVFFFVPVYLFVVGGDYMRRTPGVSFGTKFTGVTARALCWFGGAAAMAMPLMPLLARLQAG